MKRKRNSLLHTVEEYLHQKVIDIGVYESGFGEWFRRVYWRVYWRVYRRMYWKVFSRVFTRVLTEAYSVS